MAAQLGAVILAAGASQRMGTPKALLPWAGTTLLEHAIEQARAAGIEHIVVVLGPATLHLAHEPWLANVRVTCNPDPETGRSASIRIGSAALPDDVDAVVIQSVDQPCESSVLGEPLRGAGLELRRRRCRTDPRWPSRTPGVSERSTPVRAPRGERS